MKSIEFLPEAHLTDPKTQPKSAVKMKPRKKVPQMFEEEQLDEVTRRDFLKGIGAAAVGAALPGSAKAGWFSKEPPDPGKYEYRVPFEWNAAVTSGEKNVGWRDSDRKYVNAVLTINANNTLSFTWMDGLQGLAKPMPFTFNNGTIHATHSTSDDRIDPTTNKKWTAFRSYQFTMNVKNKTFTFLTQQESPVGYDRWIVGSDSSQLKNVPPPPIPLKVTSKIEPRVEPKIQAKVEPTSNEPWAEKDVPKNWNNEPTSNDSMSNWQEKIVHPRNGGQSTTIKYLESSDSRVNLITFPSIQEGSRVIMHLKSSLQVNSGASIRLLLNKKIVGGLKARIIRQNGEGTIIGIDSEYEGGPDKLVSDLYNTSAPIKIEIVTDQSRMVFTFTP